MIQIEIKYPCICGHHKLSHSNNYDSPLCDDCANFIGGSVMWHEFKLDNLKYLEQS